MKRFFYLFVMIGFQQAYAETSTETMTNEQVSQSWHQNNPNAPIPRVVASEDGTTKVQWTGSVTGDVYTNSVTSANGSTNTALGEGTFHKVVVTSDVRRTREDGAVDYFQIGLTETDDKAVLSQKSHQINNLQLGHSEDLYSVAAGDITPNFSSLSSSLGARGIMGQRKIGQSSNITGYVGTVSESWEALTGSLPRNQFLRDTYGVKIEKDLSEYIKIYGTGQKGKDRKGSVTNSSLSSYALATQLSSVTGGLQYQKEQMQINAEIATGQSEIDTQDENAGNAYILDLTWANEKVSAHAGYHMLDADFATLSSMALPGITEYYAGGDVVLKPWLTLGTDVRTTKSKTLQSLQPDTKTDSTTLRAVSNLDSTEWNLSVQNTESVTRVLANKNRVDESSATLNYTAQKWSAGLGYSLGEYRNSDNTAADSDTKNWQLNLGNSINNTGADASIPLVWSFDTMLGVTLQDQSLVTGGSIKNEMYSLTLTGQRVQWGKINIILSSGVLKQPTGADLKTNGLQFEASHDFANTSTAKIYLQNTKRNINDPLLESTEQVLGAQYNYNF